MMSQLTAVVLATVPPSTTHPAPTPALANPAEVRTVQFSAMVLTTFPFSSAMPATTPPWA
ncbi:hypothetical protein [Endozoicomonas acroporae]|uniref:hypothetical protein n=1 Tax=Endozoicomonas acroporae TaxID=1701104 RepID=UPI0013D3B2FC|nr:hypothetical protein [Endozoicomonas acroporae]